MCGIAGEIRFDRSPSQADWRYLGDLMKRRGPDDEGLWDEDERCTLVFRRLSILDLSEKGHQPMVHESGRFVLAFNGEIYNYRELRRDLEACGDRFESSGDAEVLLKALIRWDTAALAKLNGIFAIAFHDRENGSLLLARDHAGIKPLYVLRNRKGVAFASQYNQILGHPWCSDHGIDPSAVSLYLRFGYVPSPYAMIENTGMLEPGSWLRIEADGKETGGMHWQFPYPCDPSLSGDDAIAAVDEAVTNAVKRQLVSDVPVGAFLSGGIDSPLVVSKMVDAGHTSLKAFTIATGEADSDETRDARKYAEAFGVEQIVEEINYDQALKFLPEVIEACSEPLGDYSIFPTMLVSRLASKEFKVMLSGDGGDELFWGYPQRSADVIANASDFRMPLWLRRVRSGVRTALGRGTAPSLAQPTIGDWYATRHTCLKNGWFERIFPGTQPVTDLLDGFRFAGSDSDETAQWVRYNEFVYHLTMVLLKVDRASMHCSQEVRVPLLDKEVIEAASMVDWNSCLAIKTRTGKQPLRQILARRANYQSQRKMGFEAPMGSWLRGPLREQFEALVMGREHIFDHRIDRKEMNRLWKIHQSGERDFAFGLWPVLSLALWENAHFSRRAT